MNMTQTNKTRSFALLSVLTLFVIVTIAPHAFAQQNPAGQGQQNGIPLGSSYSGSGTSAAPSGGSSMAYTDANNPYGPMAAMGWAAGLAIAGVLTGVGVWSAVRKH